MCVHEDEDEDVDEDEKEDGNVCHSPLRWDQQVACVKLSLAAAAAVVVAAVVVVVVGVEWSVLAPLHVQLVVS